MEMFARQAAREGDSRRCAATLFLGKLAGVTDPEAEAQDHRRRVRRRCSRQEAAKSRPTKRPSAPLAQGTIYPDVIESGGAKSKKAVTIKSHHNVGGLPETARPEAARAAARPVQGRSARTGRGARPAARDGVPPPVPGPGPGRAHPGRGRSANTPTCCAAPTRSSSRNCARPSPGQDAAAASRAATGGQELVRPDQPGLRRVPAGEERWA